MRWYAARIFLSSPIAFCIASVLLSAACSFPRISILHDPLTPEEHDNLGRIYETEGKTDLAARQYREALKKDKKHLPSLLLLGDLSYIIKDYPEAESLYTKALKAAPGNSDVRNNLAWVYIQTGRKLDDAKKLIEEAIAMNPDHRPYYLDTLGVVLMKLGNTAGAVAALRESVDTLPREGREFMMEANGHLADAYRAAGDDEHYNEALKRQGELKNQRESH